MELQKDHLEKVPEVIGNKAKERIDDGLNNITQTIEVDTNSTIEFIQEETKRVIDTLDTEVEVIKEVILGCNNTFNKNLEIGKHSLEENTDVMDALEDSDLRVLEEIMADIETEAAKVHWSFQKNSHTFGPRLHSLRFPPYF